MQNSRNYQELELLYIRLVIESNNWPVIPMLVIKKDGMKIGDQLTIGGLEFAHNFLKQVENEVIC